MVNERTARACIVPGVWALLLRHAPLLLGLALPVLALVVYQAHAAREAAVAGAQRDVRNLARLIEAKLQGEFDHAAIVVGEIERQAQPQWFDPAWQATHRDRHNRWLQTQLTHVPAVVGLRFYDERGELIYFSEGGQQQHNVADRAYFTQVRQAPPGALVYSELIRGRVSQRVVMQVVRAIRAPDGRFLGAVAASVDMEVLHQHLQALDVGPGGVISLRRVEDGTWMVGHPEAVGLEPASPPEPPGLEGVRAGVPEGVFERVGPSDGVQRVYGYRRVGGHPLYVTVGLAQAHYLAAWRQSLFTVGCVMAAGMVAVVVMLYRLAISRQREHRSAQALLLSEHHYRSLANSGPALIWTAGPDGGCHYFNQTWLDYTGRTLAQEVGDGWLQGVHPDDAQACWADYTAALARQQPFRLEYRLRHHSGAYRWFLDQGTPTLDVQGKFSGYIGHCVDITERKQIELRLAQSESRLNLALKAARMGAWDYDFQTDVLNWSQQVFEIFNQPPQPVSRQLKQTLLHPDDRAVPDVAMQHAVSTRTAYFAEYRVVLAQGIQWVEDRGAIEFGPEGQPLRVVGIAQNITARKAEQAELIRHRNHLESLVAERTDQLLEAKERAEAASRAKTAFLANMSHEIRTPLNAISGMVYILRRSGVSPQQEDKLAKIEQASRHLLDILSAVLDLSKIEADKLTLSEHPLVLDDLLAQATALVADKARLKGLSLRVQAPRLNGRLLGDATRLQQALLNYLYNAVKFTQQGSVTLRVQVLEEDAQSIELRMSVSDTGPGIEPAALARLFTPFEQADNSITRQHGGTGLGLVIARRLVELMGGRTGVDSQPGRGSTFWLSLRLKKAPPPADPPPLSGGEPASASALDRLRQDFAGTCVLLAEDEPINREVTLTLLAHAGLQARVAEDGRQALALLTQGPPVALVLMDVQMPEMDGLEATRRIRAQEQGAAQAGLPVRRLPILAMTANAFAEDRAQCLAAGMDDFIAKPVDPEALYAAVWAGLQRAPVAAGPQALPAPNPGLPGVA